MDRLSGRRAARLAYAFGCDPHPDAIYADAAARLGLYCTAFFGYRASPQERRRLRDAWHEAMTIGQAAGVRPPAAH